MIYTKFCQMWTCGEQGLGTESQKHSANLKQHSWNLHYIGHNMVITSCGVLMPRRSTRSCFKWHTNRTFLVDLKQLLFRNQASMLIHRVLLSRFIISQNNFFLMCILIFYRLGSIWFIQHGWYRHQAEPSSGNALHLWASHRYLTDRWF